MMAMTWEIGRDVFHHPPHTCDLLPAPRREAESTITMSLSLPSNHHDGRDDDDGERTIGCNNPDDQVYFYDDDDDDEVIISSDLLRPWQRGSFHSETKT